MKRVLHLDSGRELRGGQVQLAHLVHAAPGLGVALPPDAPLHEQLVRDGVPVHPVAFGAPPWGTLDLAALVRELDPDVIAAHTSHAHAQARLVARGRPIVVHRRVDFPIGPLSRRKYRAVAGYIAVSEAVSEVLIDGGVDPLRIVVVPDGVEPDPWLVRVDREAARRLFGVPIGARWVAAVGALVDHKGHAVLIDAIAEVVRRGGAVFCTIAGDGPRREALQRRIDAAGLADVVRLTGARCDVPAWLGGVDVFVHPSVEEGLGQAVIEALLTGVPVVATAAGGVPEIVGADGRIVPKGDPVALASALAGDLPAAGTGRTRMLYEFSVSRMVSGTLAAYRRFTR